MSDFSKKIKELREEKELTQRDMARIFHVSQVTINRWENGETETDFDTLVEISKYFGVSVEYLLGADNETL